MGLTIRCFHAMNFLPASALAADLLPIQSVTADDSSASKNVTAQADASLDACIILERVTKELNWAMQEKDVTEKGLRNANHERQHLQAQLMETISVFTSEIEGLQEECVGDDRPVSEPRIPLERLQDQFRSAKSRNEGLKAELQRTQGQVEEVRREREVASLAEEAAQQELINLWSTRDLLKGRLQDLRSGSSASAQHRDQADQAHAVEVKWLRQQVEALHNQKEELRRHLTDQDRERRDLQESFLYVKQQLEKVQMKQANASAHSSSDIKKEISRLERNTDAINEERAHLSARVDHFRGEQERQKAYHQSSIDRMMAANSQLHQKRDRLRKELDRTSQLYAASVAQVQQIREQSIAPRNETFTSMSSTTPTEREEKAHLWAEISETDEAIRKKELDNDSLKNRIRKLAVRILKYRQVHFVLGPSKCDSFI